MIVKEGKERMSRPIFEVIEHIRAVVANPAVYTTLIQTEDLIVLCEAAEAAATQPGSCRMCGNPRPKDDHVCPARP